jgi:hypothetical protein
MKLTYLLNQIRLAEKGRKGRKLVACEATFNDASTAKSLRPWVVTVYKEYTAHIREGDGANAAVASVKKKPRSMVSSSDKTGVSSTFVMSTWANAAPSEAIVVPSTSVFSMDIDDFKAALPTKLLGNFALTALSTLSLSSKLSDTERTGAIVKAISNLAVCSTSDSTQAPMLVVCSNADLNCVLTNMRFRFTKVPHVFTICDDSSLLTDLRVTANISTGPWISDTHFAVLASNDLPDRGYQYNGSVLLMPTMIRTRTAKNSSGLNGAIVRYFLSRLFDGSSRLWFLDATMDNGNSSIAALLHGFQTVTCFTKKEEADEAKTRLGIFASTLQEDSDPNDCLEAASIFEFPGRPGHEGTIDAGTESSLSNLTLIQSQVRSESHTQNYVSNFGTL